MVDGKSFRRAREPDDGGPEIFCHISGFNKRVDQAGIFAMQYRRRLVFKTAVDPRNDWIIAVNVFPVPRNPWPRWRDHRDEAAQTAAEHDSAGGSRASSQEEARKVRRLRRASGSARLRRAILIVRGYIADTVDYQTGPGENTITAR